MHPDKKKPFAKRLPFILIALAIAAVLIYQLPPVKSRLEWRLAGWWTALRLTLDPVGELPTANPDEVLLEATTAPIFPTDTPNPPPQASPATPTNLPDVTAQPTATALPAFVQLDTPRWEKQDWNNCGPATMAMYLRYYGWEGDQFTISELIKPERTDRNVNIEELTWYVLNYAGWLKIQYRVGGDADTLKQLIAAGIPVMIEEGDELAEGYWYEDDRWAGHYLLLTGYDDAEEVFIVQDSFRASNREVSYEETDMRWHAFNRIYIVIYLPHQEEEVKAILGDNWDLDTNRQSALEQAQGQIVNDPDDALAWFNLGSNLVYFERYAEAADAYDEAAALGQPQRMLRYQFGPFFAYFHSNRGESLQTTLDYALKITPNAEEALVWQGWLYYRLGENELAVENFREAYWYNPLSYDAQYALNYMGASP